MLSQRVTSDEKESAATNILPNENSTEDDSEVLGANLSPSGELDVIQQLKYLITIARGPQGKQNPVWESIISLGDDQTRLKLLSEIYHVEKNEIRPSKEVPTTNGSKARPVSYSQSAVYCMIAGDVVRQFKGELSSIIDEKDNNILHLAVSGTPDILRAILESIKSKGVSELEGLVTGLNTKGETPLEIASMGNEIPHVELLADFQDEKREDHVLKAARQGRLDLLKILLRGQDSCLDTLITPKVLEAVAKSQEDGRDKVWEFITQKMPDLEPDIRLLNIAITNCQVEIVCLILKDHPMLLDKMVDEKVESSAAHVASQGITESMKDKIIRKANTLAKKRFSELGKTSADRQQFLKAEEVKIRKYLDDAPKIIQSMVLEKMVRKLSVHRINLLWPKEDGKTKEACLDLNLPNSRNGAFAKFINTARREVDELYTQQPDAKLVNSDQNARAQTKESGNTETAQYGKFRAEFHPILKYVAFPDLDEIRQNSPGKMEGLVGREVKIVLDWLRMVKRVEKIIEVRVPDSRYEPCSEEMIENAAVKFDVEELNWKRIDLSARGLREAGSKVEILHLYSSGSWTPLCHWMGEEGLISLAKTLKLRTVHISIIEDNITSKRAEDQQNEMENWLKNHKPFLLTEPDKSIDASNISSVKCIKWKRAGPKKPEHGIPDISRYPSRVTKLNNFLDYYRTKRRNLEKKNQFEPVKVAIIDTGVDESDFDTKIYKNGFKGESFVRREDMESHWWFSSDAHGSQMAKIISSIDPGCQLYIAKVGDYKEDISVDRVAKAIKWAADKDVDIISMSFALDKEGKDLTEEVINAASRKGIVLICSTADEGNNQPEVWPASYSDTLDIAACDEMGYLAPYSNQRAKYYFQGQKIVADASQFTDSQEEIGGSSVSTALAAGVASLILASCRIDKVEVNKAKRKEKVEFWFGEMKGKDSKYVRPWVVFGEGQRGSGSMFLPKENRLGI